MQQASHYPQAGNVEYVPIIWEQERGKDIHHLSTSSIPQTT